MTCYMKTIYGILQIDQTVIWFWISCWDDPVDLPVAA